MSNHREKVLESLELGKATRYATEYDPSLLQTVPRSIARDVIGVGAELPFTGVDIWYGYELSWLRPSGIPQVAVMRCTVPCNTDSIVESKSFKLYLNSFNQSQFESMEVVSTIIKRDVDDLLQAHVVIDLFTVEELATFSPSEFAGDCIDDLDVSTSTYTVNTDLLQSDGISKVKETLHSHLLKSNCLVTNQPDWASVVIDYTGQKLDRSSLLTYLVSFRNHNEFHEQCVERIFVDLWTKFELTELSVQAFYTRRGGLDINPFRSSSDSAQPRMIRSNRQ